MHLLTRLLRIGMCECKTPTTEMRIPILYSIKIDVTNKDWCPIPSLLVMAQPQKPGSTHNKGGTVCEHQHRRKGGLQFANTNTGEEHQHRRKHRPTACYFMETPTQAERRLTVWEDQHRRRLRRVTLWEHQHRRKQHP